MIRREVMSYHMSYEYDYEYNEYRDTENLLGTSIHNQGAIFPTVAVSV